MGPEIDKIYRFEAFVLDVGERQLFQDGKAVVLTPKVFDVLAYLVKRSGHLVQKEELLQEIWPDSFVEEANIARIIHTLRKTLGNGANGEQLIETVPKKGYRFADVVTTSEREVFDTTVKPLRTAKTSRPWLLASIVAALVVLIGVASVTAFLNRSGRTPGISFEGMVPIRMTASGDILAPDISPDGKELVFIKNSGGMFGLQVEDLSSGKVRELIPPRPGIRYWGARFDRDGRFIYYVENNNNDSGTLYRIPSSGGDSEKIADSASGGIARTSPDGKYAVFVRTDKGAGITSLVICNGEGGNERVLAQMDTNRVFMSVDWGPDGSSVTYVMRDARDGRSTFSIIDKKIQTGEEIVILEPVERWIISALWLPGKQGLLINAIDETSKLPQIFFRGFPDGEERRVTNDLGYYHYLSLTGDGRSIFTQKIEQDRYIWYLPDVSRPAATQLTFEKDQHFDAVDWLDSDTLVFDPDFNGSHQRRNLFTLDIGSPKPVALTEGSDDNTLPRVAPDGAMTYISSKAGAKQLWRTGPNGSVPVQVTNIPHRLYEHRSSPDGRWLYFQYTIGGQGRLARIPSTGGEITEIGGKEVYQWSLSPDGTKIAYNSLDESTGKFSIRIRSVDDPKTLQIFAIEASNHIVWSRSGDQIYFVADRDLRKNVWRQPLNGGEPVRVTDFPDAEILDFAESPDGRSLAVIRSTTSFDAVRFDFAK